MGAKAQWMGSGTILDALVCHQSHTLQLKDVLCSIAHFTQSPRAEFDAVGIYFKDQVPACKCVKASHMRHPMAAQRRGSAGAWGLSNRRCMGAHMDQPTAACR